MPLICYEPMTRDIAKIPCKGNHYFHAKCARKHKDTQVGDTVSCHLCRFEYVWPPEFLDHGSEICQKWGNVEMTCQIEHCHLKYPAKQHHLHMKTHPMDKIKEYTRLRREGNAKSQYWRIFYGLHNVTEIEAKFPVLSCSKFSLPRDTRMKISLNEKQHLVFEVITLIEPFGVWLFTAENEVDQTEKQGKHNVFHSRFPLTKYQFNNTILFHCGLR